MTDEQIIDGLIARNNATVNYIYEKFYNDIYLFLISLGASESICEDVFHNSLIAVITHFDKHNNNLKYSFKNFLFTICKYQFINTIRDEENQRKYISTNKNGTIEEIPEIYDEEKTQEIIKQTFQKLDKSCQEILKSYCIGLTPDEVAKNLDTTNGYIRKRKSICMDKWVALLQENPIFNELINNNAPWPNILNIY